MQAYFKIDMMYKSFLEVFAILTVNRLSKYFGGICAVNDVDMVINDGEIVGLIGPNGAGKTTIFNLLTGIYAPTSGNICLDKRRIEGLPNYKIARLGISRTFQNIRLFGCLSVFDNLKVAASINKIDLERIDEILKLIGLYEKKDVIVKNLPYGEQKYAEIGRSLATGASMLFLDEPAAGLNPHETDALSKLICQIKEKYNLTIVLIEHDMSLVMSICQRIYVLDFGSMIATGTPNQIKSNQAVIKAYLGSA
jgi:branched-chain amino acid transport system ATP-binding protein